MYKAVEYVKELAFMYGSIAELCCGFDLDHSCLENNNVYRNAESDTTELVLLLDILETKLDEFVVYLLQQNLFICMYIKLIKTT